MLKKILEKANKEVSKFDYFDWAFLKICLISIGLLIGIYFAMFLRQYIKIIWIVAILLYAYTMYAIFVRKK